MRYFIEAPEIFDDGGTTETEHSGLLMLIENPSQESNKSENLSSNTKQERRSGKSSVDSLQQGGKTFTGDSSDPSDDEIVVISERPHGAFPIEPPYTGVRTFAELKKHVPSAAQCKRGMKETTNFGILPPRLLDKFNVHKADGWKDLTPEDVKFYAQHMRYRAMGAYLAYHQSGGDYWFYQYGFDLMATYNMFVATHGVAEVSNTAEKNIFHVNCSQHFYLFCRMMRNLPLRNLAMRNLPMRNLCLMIPTQNRHHWLKCRTHPQRKRTRKNQPRKLSLQLVKAKSLQPLPTRKHH